jgi:hypothetical protein
MEFRVIDEGEIQKVANEFPFVKESLENYKEVSAWRSELGFFLNHSFRHYDLHQLPGKFLLELWADSHLAVEEAWKEYSMRHKMCSLMIPESVPIGRGKKVKC